MLISFMWNLSELIPCFQKFDILLLKPFSDLSILPSSIPIYLTYVLLRDNSLFYLIECTFWQRNTVRVICFAKFNNHTTQLFLKMNQLFRKMNIICWSVISWKLCLHKQTLFLEILLTGRHKHTTRFAINGLLILSSCNTSKFDTKAVLYFTITSGNYFQALFSEKKFGIISPMRLKRLLKDYLFSLYAWELPFLSLIFQL